MLQSATAQRGVFMTTSTANQFRSDTHWGNTGIVSNEHSSNGNCERKPKARVFRKEMPVKRMHPTAH